MARLIDVDEAMSSFLEECTGYEDEKVFSCHDVDRILDSVAAVDAVPVVYGEWRFGKFNAGVETVFVECSECDAVFEVSPFSLGLNYNYCPNCGAKMDGGKDA